MGQRDATRAEGSLGRGTRRKAGTQNRHRKQAAAPRSLPLPVRRPGHEDGQRRSHDPPEQNQPRLVEHSQAGRNGRIRPRQLRQRNRSPASAVPDPQSGKGQGDAKGQENHPGQAGRARQTGTPGQSQPGQTAGEATHRRRQHLRRQQRQRRQAPEAHQQHVRPAAGTGRTAPRAARGFNLPVPLLPRV
uniref:(northern house mosquito) hypothetical protein n=1 Tax=Culex pipiens TaxID=7175 RepID=A0A8D8JWF0_CULPI